MIVSLAYDFDSVDISSVSSVFLLYLRPWLSIRPLPYAVARAIGNTNDMRFSYDHIADVRRVRMRPAWGMGTSTRPRITPIHTLVRTHRLAASVRNPHAPAHMRTMRSAMRMVESRCETSSTALPCCANASIDCRITDSL